MRRDTSSGPSPSAAEVLAFVRRDAGRLIDTALVAPAVPAGEGEPSRDRTVNPKRLARQAAREQRRVPTSTAAQAALAAAREQAAAERRDAGRHRRAEEAERRRELAVARRRARHRGH